MKKIILLTLIFISSSSAFSQYTKPYRITFNPINKSYLITNRGNGTITELDSFYNTSTVITGLKDPRDLTLGSFAGTAGLLVIDDNKLVVYNAANYQKLISFSVSGASDLEDIEIDTFNPGYFYISDVGNNRILKGKVGAPPFYTPSFKVLNTNKIHRPKGLLLDKKGRLLVVSDSLKGQVFKVDTSSGAASLIYTSDLDSLNHISEDKEGNFYLTNWSNSYLYRTDASFNSLTKLTSYNKPAGMFINAETDLMLIVCHLCNKLEFHKLHYVEPRSDIYSCARDSITADVDIQLNGIGTYGSTNNFLIEMSDANGSFAKATVIGSVKSDEKPTEIKGFVPNGKYTSSYQYRIRSTHPSFASQPKNLNIYATPDVTGFIEDSLFICNGSSTKMAKSNAASYSFSWSPSLNLDDSTKLDALYTAVSDGSFKYQLVIKNKAEGCADSGSVVVWVTPNIVLNPWKRKIQTCKNVPINIGGSQSDYTYTWSPVNQLSDSTSSNPLFSGNQSEKYYVLVEDPQNGCTGNDSVEVTVNPLPNIDLKSDSFKTCNNQEVTIGAENNPDLTYKWFFPFHLSDSTGAKVVFKQNQPGTYQYLLRATDANKCHTDTNISVVNIALPAFSDFSVKYITKTYKDLQIKLNSAPENYVTIFWDSASIGTYSKLVEMANVRDSVIRLILEFGQHKFYAEITSIDGCTTISDTVTVEVAMGVNRLKILNVSIFPNPTQNNITIKNPALNIEQVSIYSTTGELIFNQDVVDRRAEMFVDLSELGDGLYWIQISTETTSAGQYLLKQN